MNKPKYWACTCCSENCLLVTSGELPAACILDPDDTDEVPWREITRDEFQRRDDLVNDPSYIAQTMGDVPLKETRKPEATFLDYVLTLQERQFSKVRQREMAGWPKIPEADLRRHLERPEKFWAGVDPAGEDGDSQVAIDYESTLKDHSSRFFDRLTREGIPIVTNWPTRQWIDKEYEGMLDESAQRLDQHINAAINSKSRGVVTKRWAVPGLVLSDEIRYAIDEGFEQMYKAFETSRINWLMRDWRLEFIGEDPND